ncbi:uncharacterized protein BO80DRAFT_463548 [Aspergillus ibericus CBS 121593]|uniref:Uncharacterized protein n=1 Tax=Aspergillus ibericus CBS 121593 TaxID=1448316 RepID=A0A395H363_9EURO|nr:hypothetical protein BO80DRAFT_463548 [Aspergillus ibericus CBS 121593]RAL02321.1 hypothetical protein BO80DRAFT_463548 [Aspergillus ibericus CBS 121593]
MIKTKLLVYAALGYSICLWLLCTGGYVYLVVRTCVELVRCLGRILALDAFESVFEAFLVICDSVSPIWFLKIYVSIEVRVHDAFKGREHPPYLERRIASKLFFRPPIIIFSCTLQALSETDGEDKRLEEHTAADHDSSLSSNGDRTFEVTGSETPDDELRSEANYSDGHSCAADTDFSGPGEQAEGEDSESDHRGEELIDTDIESQADTEDGGVPLPVRLLAFAESKDYLEHHDCNEYPTETDEIGELDMPPTPCSLGESSGPVRTNMPEQAPIGNKEGPVPGNPSSEFDLPGTGKPPTPSTPGSQETTSKDLDTDKNSMDFEANKKAWMESVAATSLKLERLAGSWWDETLAVMAAGSEETEAFTKAARAASQEMEALLRDTAKATNDLEQAKQAWIASTSKASTLEHLNDSLWDETLAVIRAASEEAKAALEKVASTGDKAVEPHRSKDQPNKSRPMSKKPRQEPEERNPDCIDPEKDFYDVCWDILQETNLVGVYMKDKMLREQSRKKHPKRCQRKEKDEKRERGPEYNVCCDCQRAIK